MKASKRHLIEASEKELVELMHKGTENGKVLSLAFGPSGAALIWEEGEPMPWYVEQIGLMRGVLNENCEGAGI